MSRAGVANKVALIKLAAVCLCSAIGVVAVFKLPTIYLYLLLFFAGVGAFFMIGYQLLGMMREDDVEVAPVKPQVVKQSAATTVGSLPTNDRIVLDWSRECLEAGNSLEAGSKLERISATCRNHPDVLKLRHEIYFTERRWVAALDVAKAWAAIAPNEPLAWEAQAACLGEMRQYQKALELLAPLADRFPKQNTLPYRLSQICSEMGRLEEAQRWLFKALDSGDKKQLVRRAMADSALEPLIHFLGRRALVESIIANPDEAAGQAALAFAERRGIDLARCGAKGLITPDTETGTAFKARRKTAAESQPHLDPTLQQYDATVIFAENAEGNEGVFQAVELAAIQRRPYILIRKDKPEADPVAEFLTFIEQHRVLGLRIVGDNSKQPELQDYVSQTLDAAFDYQLRSLLHGTVTPASLRG